MRPYDKEIENIKKQIMDQYHPSDIILFGSCAKGAIHKGSDKDDNATMAGVIHRTGVSLVGRHQL